MKNKNVIRLTESELKNMISETIRTLMEGYNDESNNSHYAVHKQSNKIVFAWDYSDYDADELRTFKKDYFFNDLIDMEMNPKDFTILTRKGCIRKGIDPSIDSNWTNSMFNESIIKESSNITRDFDIDLYYVEITNPELDEYLAELDLPETIAVSMSFYEEPYDKGDYYTPPSGGYVELGNYEIDTDGVFKKLIAPEYYQAFIQDVASYIDSHSEKFETEVTEEDEPEYDYWEKYKDRKLGL